MRCLFPKWKIFSLEIKSHLFPLDMLVALLERQFLEAGTITYCSVSVLWRDGGLAGPGLGGGAQRTAGWVDWVSLSGTGAVRSEGKAEREHSSKEAFSYGRPGHVSSLHLLAVCLSEMVRATLGEIWLSILRWGREGAWSCKDIAMHPPNSWCFSKTLTSCWSLLVKTLLEGIFMLPHRKKKKKVTQSSPLH